MIVVDGAQWIDRFDSHLPLLSSRLILSVVFSFLQEPYLGSLENPINIILVGRGRTGKLGSAKKARRKRGDARARTKSTQTRLPVSVCFACLVPRW